MIIVSYPLRFRAGIDGRLDDQIRILMESHGMADVGSGAGGGMRDLEFSFEIDDTSEEAVRQANLRQYALMRNEPIMDEIVKTTGNGGCITFQLDEVFDESIDDWRAVEGDYAAMEFKK